VKLFQGVAQDSPTPFSSTSKRVLHSGQTAG
jgi:hypothetical protein